jgi:ABC-type Mn2+/Zn2+ transport system permease subunit
MREHAGCFAVMRRMTLAADALSHVALPGIGVALALGIHPLFGAIAMLMFGALIIWSLEQRTRIATEAIIGVVFTTALAVGSLMSSGEELIDALFGGSNAQTVGELVFGAAVAIAIGTFIVIQRSRLILWLVSPEIARTAGIDVVRLNLMFLMMFSLTIALGLHFLGVLLMGSLIIIPAVTAKRLARSLAEMMGYAVGVAAVATVVGTYVAHRVHRPTGPIIITMSAALFVASLVKPRR